MTRLTNGPIQMMAIALFAVTGLAAANPMASFVDCSDSFWAITCGMDDAGTDVDSGDVLVGTLATIDNDPVCAALNGGYFLCHT